MAILPTNTNTTVTPFIPHMGTPLTPQGESSPIELLNGAINSLRNDAPTQANERVKQLQQVSPATANRIFHLTWERSGKPMHFGSRFGEEAFFGYWGRSIDPSIKLGILSQVLEDITATNAEASFAAESQIAPVSQEESNGASPLSITETALAILSHCDLQTLGRLARVNRFFNACAQAHVEQLDLQRFCPNLRILDAEAQGITINDEPRISKLWILKNYIELKSHIENEEGLTLLTMPKGLTLNQLIAIAEQAGIGMGIEITDPYWGQVLKNRYGNIPVEQTYVILITNNVFQQSRDKGYAQQQELVSGHRCVMPTVQEHVALCIFTNKVFQKYLYRQKPWTYGRTSTQVNGYPLNVGASFSTGFFVERCDPYCNREHIGAGGQRKYGH